MGKLTYYSNRPDLLHELEVAADHLQRARVEGMPSVRSVRSPDRKGRVHSLAERLTEAQVRKIVLAFEAGTPRWRLAERYSISLSSVGRLLRQARQRRNLT